MKWSKEENDTSKLHEFDVVHMYSCISPTFRAKVDDKFPLYWFVTYNRVCRTYCFTCTHFLCCLYSTSIYIYKQNACYVLLHWKLLFDITALNSHTEYLFSLAMSTRSWCGCSPLVLIIQFLKHFHGHPNSFVCVITVPCMCSFMYLVVMQKSRYDAPSDRFNVFVWIYLSWIVCLFVGRAKRNILSRIQRKGRKNSDEKSPKGARELPKSKKNTDTTATLAAPTTIQE